MSAAEGDGVLIHTVNSFGRQSHLNKKRSRPIPFPTDAAGDALRSSFSQPLPKAYEHANGNGREAVITASGGSSHAFWFDAEACAACEKCGASPSRSSGTWHDAASEAGSTASSLGGTSDYCCSAEVRKRSRSSSSGGTPGSLDDAISTADWQARLVDEGRRRRAAEEGAAQLREQRQQLSLQLRSLEEARRDDAAAAKRAAADAEVAAARALADAAAASESQVAVARLVAGAFARATARVDTEAAALDLRQEVELLRQRVERMGRMTGAMRARALVADADSEDTLQRRLAAAGVAVACAGAGVAGAFLVIRHLKSGN